MRSGFIFAGCCACGSPSFCGTEREVLGWDEPSPLGFSGAAVAAMLGDVVRVDVTWGSAFSTTPPTDAFWLTLEPADTVEVLRRASNLPVVQPPDCYDELVLALPAQVASDDGGVVGAGTAQVTAAALDFDNVVLQYDTEVTLSDARREEVVRVTGSAPESVTVSLIHSRADFEQATIVAQADVETYTTVWACAGGAECATWTLSASSE